MIKLRATLQPRVPVPKISTWHCANEPSYKEGNTRHCINYKFIRVSRYARWTGSSIGLRSTLLIVFFRHPLTYIIELLGNEYYTGAEVYLVTPTYSLPWWLVDISSFLFDFELLLLVFKLFLSCYLLWCMASYWRYKSHKVDWTRYSSSGLQLQRKSTHDFFSLILYVSSWNFLWLVLSLL